MRTSIICVISLGLAPGVVSCGMATPTAPVHPVLLTSQSFGSATDGLGYDGPLGAVNLGPSAYGLGLISGPMSVWASSFAGFAAVPAFAAPWGGPMGIGGLAAGGLGAQLPQSGWGTPSPWTGTTQQTLAGLGQSGLNAGTAPVGWGSRTWGPSGTTLGPSGGTWGVTPQPGQYNLSHGAADIGGWGLDAGFFSIPQQEQRQRLDQAMAKIDAGPATPARPTSTNSQVPAGTSKLDPAKYPFLHPVNGPLVPPK